MLLSVGIQNDELEKKNPKRKYYLEQRFENV